MKPERPEQEITAEMVNDILRMIRLQFCPDMDEKTWLKDNYHFIRKRVILWPASFIQGKGFTLPIARYKAIQIGILTEIKRHGQTGQVRIWHAYLTKCVQEHWKKHWEEYYQEAKAVTARADLVMLGLSKLKTGERPGIGVEILAAAHKISSQKKPKKIVKPLPPPEPPAQEQFSLF